MAITVKGVEVRPEEVNLELDFRDLTAEGQKRFFLERKEMFILEALKSRYSSVVEAVGEARNECSSYALNIAIEYVLRRGLYGGVDLVLQFLSVPGFELNEANRKKLACSEYWKLRLWVAKDEKTPLKILKKKKMLFNAIRDFEAGSSLLFDAIVENSNFEVDEQVKRILEPFSSETVEKVIARIKELKK